MSDAAEWHEVGSELEALLDEATLIRDLRPVVNVQVGPPDLGRSRRAGRRSSRTSSSCCRRSRTDSAELVAARADGGWMIQRTRRNGADLAVHARRLLRFFNSPLRRGDDAAPLAPIVFSWLAGRGATSSRLDPRDAPTLEALQSSLAALLRDEATVYRAYRCAVE